MTAKQTKPPADAKPAEETPDLMAPLVLWNLSRTPDPKHVKGFNRGGFKGSATNGTYLAQLATEIFGPNGIGWGLEILNEDYINGEPIIDKATGQLTSHHHIVHVLRCHAWYVVNGERFFTSPQFGQTTFVGENKNGLFTDEEAPKKSMTDAMSKCLSLIGFAADIHLGRWDDSKYVNSVKAEFAAAEGKAGPTVTTAAERLPLPPELADKHAAFIQRLAVCQTSDALAALTDEARALYKEIYKVSIADAAVLQTDIGAAKKRIADLEIDCEVEDPNPNYDDQA